MRTTRATTAAWRCLAALGAIHLGAAGAAGAASPVEELLRRQTEELMDALAPGKAEVWQHYLLDQAVYLDENGVAYSKEKLLPELTPLPPGLVGRIEVDRFEPTLLGGTAVVVAEIQEYLDYHGQQLRTRFRFLDTWVETPAGWRLLARHTAAVLKDPPAVQLSPAELCEYAGRYELTPEIVTVVRCVENALSSERTGRPAATLRPELRDLFFEAGKPRVRRLFLRDGEGKVVAFADRREGEDILWKRVGPVSD
jgi:hypothetical protein